MEKNRKKRVSTITLVIILLPLAAVYVLFLLTPSSPDKEMEEARKALSDAKKLKADIYAPATYKRAQQIYDSVIFLWKAENNKFILFRSYDHLDSSINQVIYYSNVATNQAADYSEEVETSVDAEIDRLKFTVKKYESLVRSLPLKKSIRENFETGRLLSIEAEHAFKESNFLLAEQKIKSAWNKVSSSVHEINGILEEYFSSFNNWISWNKIAIEESKKTGRPGIVIDKTAKKCYLYKRGKLKHTFAIELGKNWIGDKQMKGDKTTPEGNYKVIKKLDKSQTKYYKALLINYPNEHDISRFNENKKNGSIPKGAQIGGLIEIHGEGGKGVDWTDGCIALENNDMDILFKMAEAGTPVIIVGSLVSLQDILKNLP
jgi:hypothetical protein